MTDKYDDNAALLAHLIEVVPEEDRIKWASELPQKPGKYRYADWAGVWTRDENGVWTDPKGHSEGVEANFVLAMGGSGALWKPADE